MIHLSSYLSMVRLSVWRDSVVTIGFATPWTFAAIHHSLVSLILISGRPGGFPAFAAAHTPCRFARSSPILRINKFEFIRLRMLGPLPILAVTI